MVSNTSLTLFRVDLKNLPMAHDHALSKCFIKYTLSPEDWKKLVKGRWPDKFPYLNEQLRNCIASFMSVVSKNIKNPYECQGPINVSLEGLYQMVSSIPVLNNEISPSIRQELIVRRAEDWHQMVVGHFLILFDIENNNDICQRVSICIPYPRELTRGVDWYPESTISALDMIYQIGQYSRNPVVYQTSSIDFIFVRQILTVLHSNVKNLWNKAKEWAGISILGGLENYLYSTYKTKLKKLTPNIELNHPKISRFSLKPPHKSVKYQDHKDLSYQLPSNSGLSFLLLIFLPLLLFQSTSCAGLPGIVVLCKMDYDSENLTCNCLSDDNQIAAQSRSFNCSDVEDLLQSIYLEQRKNMNTNLISLQKSRNINSATLEVIFKLYEDCNKTIQYLFNSKKLTSDEIKELPMTFSFNMERLKMTDNAFVNQMKDKITLVCRNTLLLPKKADTPGNVELVLQLTPKEGKTLFNMTFLYTSNDTKFEESSLPISPSGEKENVNVSEFVEQITVQIPRLWEELMKEPHNNTSERSHLPAIVSFLWFIVAVLYLCYVFWDNIKQFIAKAKRSINATWTRVDVSDDPKQMEVQAREEHVVISTE